jgi:hypothetical protein
MKREVTSYYLAKINKIFPSEEGSEDLLAMSQEETSNMFAIESSNKLEDASNYGIWRVKIMTILMKEDLWDLVNPTLAYQDERA